MSDTPLTLADLERWELFGARWRVVELSDERALMDMCACTGQLVERRASEDRALIDYVRAAMARDGKTTRARSIRLATSSAASSSCSKICCAMTSVSWS